jgi:4-hydroxy 2-oxovalerate aldolase
MDADEVERIVLALRTGWTGALGIHTHNNMGKALDNTLCANRLGVEWLDVTVSGMGRGAGNAQTENLLAVLSLTSNHYKPEPIYDLVIRYFEAMQKECGWGSSLLYFIGAQHNVHPTYVQNLLSDSRYGADEIVGAISYLSKANASSYDGAVLEKALKIDAPDSIVSGDASIANAFAKKEVLIIGNGGQLNRYQQGLTSYIQQYNPIVLSININPAVDAGLIDFYVVSHNSKFLSQKKYYTGIQKPIILPKHRFTEEELQAINPNIVIHDYGLMVTEGQFSVEAAHATIPSELTAAYAIAIALAGNAKKISLVGFEGYEKSDQRQQEMIDFLIALHDKHQGANIVALTPTTYPIKKSSIYAPAF